MKMRYGNFAVIKGANEFLDEKNRIIYDDNNNPYYCAMYADGIYHNFKLDDSVQVFMAKEFPSSDRLEFFPCDRETFLKGLQECVDDDIRHTMKFYRKMKGLVEGA